MLLETRETVVTGVSCQGQNKFSPGGPHGGMKSSWGEIPNIVKYPSPSMLWEGSPVGPPGEKLHKTFQFDAGGCVSKL